VAVTRGAAAFAGWAWDDFEDDWFGVAELFDEQPATTSIVTMTGSVRAVTKAHRVTAFLPEIDPSAPGRCQHRLA
jgi:uncharacterized protein (DUF1684 family)